MKLRNYRQTYYDYSGKASDIARQLSFAGIAIIWIFKIQKDTSIELPKLSTIFINVKRYFFVNNSTFFFQIIIEFEYFSIRVQCRPRTAYLRRTVFLLE